MRRAIVVLGLGLGCTLRGDGERASVVRELPVFAAIELFDGFDATLTIDPDLPAADPVQLTVSGDDNALGRLFTVMHGESTLSVAVDPSRLTQLRLTPAIEASVPALRSAYAADSSSLAILGASGALELETLASATMTLAGAGPLSVHATARHESSLMLAGQGPLLELVVEDAASVDASGFAAERVRVHARGDGAITVCATGAIKIFGAGAARVELACE